MIDINVKINTLLNFTRKSDVEKAEKIRLLISNVINDVNFRKKVLEADFKDRRYINEKGDEFIINDNQEILNKMISGKEQFSGEAADYEWDLRITLYRSITREIGYRSRENIFTKKRKFRVYNERYLASHWIHEYMHVIGFTHDFKRTVTRPYSVPYLIGNIAGEILETKEFDFLT